MARRRVSALVLVAVAVLGVSGCSSPTGPVIERRDIALDLLVDGSVEVAETLRVSFAGGPYSSFERFVALERADALFDVRATIDGVPLGPEGAERVTVAPGRHVDVRWHFPAVSSGTRQFGLRYRASNAVSLSGANALLYLTILPIQPAYPVLSTAVILTVPRETVFLATPTIDTTDIWTITASASGLEASRTEPRPDERATVWARMAADTLAIAEPQWQYDAERSAELRPAWLSAGLFMVVIGLGVIWTLRVRYPDPGRAVSADVGAGAVGVLAPAMAHVVGKRRHTRTRLQIARSIADLTSRGVLEADVGRDAPRPDLREHERVLVDELWLRNGRASPDGLVAAPRRVRRKFRQALTRDLVAAGLVDADRAVTADGLWVAGAAVLGLGGLCALAVPVVLSRFGVWPYALPAGIGVLGAMLLPVAATFSILTVSGERTARALRRAG